MSNFAFCFTLLLVKPKLIQHYLQIEDGHLWNHLSSLGAFEHLPYKRLGFLNPWIYM